MLYFWEKSITPKMMKRLLLLLLFPVIVYSQPSGTQSFILDISRVVNDQVKVVVDASQMHFGESPVVNFHFPATIPGTYATLDYGRFIHKFRAYDSTGVTLKVRKDQNTFTIDGVPSKLEYWVSDTYDARIWRNKVFEPAGTNIQEGQNFLINASGFFGFFDGAEELPVQLEVRKDPMHYGVSALDSYIYGNTQNFHARNYHTFLDSPILFSQPDTTSFRLANAKVTLGVFTESGRELSQGIYDEVHTSMRAIEQFLGGTFPVDHYAFLFYIKDYSEFKEMVEGTNFSVGKGFKLIREMWGQGFGALEHGNSSVYFLPDFGNDLVLKEMADVCIHEFFHILTPLNLHSEEIGQFNYIHPKMSQHLWLYEGITEYFAGISQVKGGVISPSEYLGLLRGKIKSATQFPHTEMSFTEMSSGVLEQPWKKQYPQVYQRGALLGALLDIRIMELTGGQKTLRDVVLALSQKYGADQSFKDEEFIDIFVAEVHPDLQAFFDAYITGRQDLPVESYLSKVGVEYSANYRGPVLQDPLIWGGVKVKSKGGILQSIQPSKYKVVQRVGESNPLKLQPGDVVLSYEKALFDTQVPLKEGESFRLNVVRSGQLLKVPYPVHYQMGQKKDYIRFDPNADQGALRLREKWLSN